ncbi:MAG TPA: hypothetical protein PK156_46875 [Polyangium sp.]|nr:hypothetical protein [Polyangium sp.]
MLPSFVFIGYLPKNIVTRPEWLESPAVEFVANVSECVSPAPPERLNQGQHNAFGLYDTPELAASTIPAEAIPSFTLFAYFISSVIFHEGRAMAWDPLTNLVPASPRLAPGFDEHIGFDIVGYRNGSFFECSPLSCNGAAKDFKVNRFCLVDDAERALSLAKDFSKPDSRVEPAWGYVVVDVRRSKTHV